jgi:TIR domain
MDVMPSAPLNVFISYSHRDEDLRKQLDKHLSNLKRQKKILPWHDRAIEAGSEWDAEIKHQLETASIILLPISHEFMASDYCYDLEMQRAVKRHHEGTARVIPFILRPVDWKDSPFSKLQVLPKDAKPVTQWSDPNEAFLNVGQGIRIAVESLQAARLKEASGAMPENVRDEWLERSNLPSSPQTLAKKYSLKMIPIPAKREEKQDKTEGSPYQIEIPPLHMSRYPITNAQWSSVVMEHRDRIKLPLDTRIEDNACRRGFLGRSLFGELIRPDLAVYLLSNHKNCEVFFFVNC